MKLSMDRENSLQILISWSSKRIIFGLSTLLFLNSAVHAISPVGGTYLGIMVGGSYIPKTSYVFTHPTTKTTLTGTVTHSLFGDGALSLGNRFCDQYRVEGELLIDYNPYNQLTANGVTFNKKQKTGIGMRGNTTMGAIMVNGFYDFFTPGGMSSFVPYVGIGLGYSRILNKITFFNNNVAVPGATASSTVTSPAGQGVIGASYFLDDFSAFSLDYRYLTTQSIAPLNQRLKLSSLNLTFTGALNAG